MNAFAGNRKLEASEAARFAAPPSRDGRWADELRSGLIEYWARMSHLPLPARLRRLEQCVSSSSPDASKLRGLAVAALADSAPEVVFAATLQYLSIPRRVPDLRVAHVDDALHWAGRRLTLRPDAVFAALLVQRDATIDARLAPIRCVTNSVDVADVLCATGHLDALCRSEFMAEWRALERTELDSD